MTHDIKNIGPNIQHHRKRLALSQASLASALDVTSMTISRLERGQRTPSVARLIQLAHALGISPSGLTRESAEMEKGVSS